MKKAFFLVALMILSSTPLFAKVRLLTFHCNKPEFITIQYKAFQKFLQDDFELIVFNDASTKEHEEAIKNVCAQYDIKCIRFEQQWHETDVLNAYIKKCVDSPDNYSHLCFPPDNQHYARYISDVYSQYSVRHCHVIQYALNHFGYIHDDIVAIVDGDAFPIRSINLRNFLGENAISGIQKSISEEGIDYLWVVFVAFDPRKLPHLHDFKFHVDVINHKLHDTGAHSYYYLKEHPDVKVKKYLGFASTGFYHWNLRDIEAFGFKPHEAWLIKSLPWPQCVEFHMDNYFLHFGGSSWDLEGWSLKWEYVKTFMDRILNE